MGVNINSDTSASTLYGIWASHGQCPCALEILTLLRDRPQAIKLDLSADWDVAVQVLIHYKRTPLWLERGGPCRKQATRA